MDNENPPSSEGCLDFPAGENVPETQAYPVYEGRSGIRLACIHGGKQEQEADKRLDEQKEFEKFWASFTEFDR